MATIITVMMTVVRTISKEKHQLMPTWKKRSGTAANCVTPHKPLDFFSLCKDIPQLVIVIGNFHVGGKDFQGF